ncbi:AzlC family ABC transporter permease [bacterium]|nr:AzlC family ABC transporter permease [bacterium]
MDQKNSPVDLKKNVLQGFIVSMPVVVGYIPIGFAFGVLAKKVGLSSMNAVFMSIIVFAGSSQLIAIGLLVAGASALSIIIATFIVNLRHLLMTAALSPYLKRWRALALTLFSYQITDETFAIHAERFSSGDTNKTAAFTINIVSQLSWITGTVLGIATSGFIKDVKPFALDYALIAMFIGLLVFQIKSKTQILVAILSGCVSILLYLAGIDQWNIILATLLSATFGILVEKWIKKRFY